MAAKESKIAFWVLISLAIAVIVVAIILIIIAAVLITTYKDAIFGAFFNTNTCVPNPNRCVYTNLNPPAPTVFPDAFTKPIAVFCGQQILNLEYLSQNNSLNLPASLTLVGLLPTKEKGAPLFAYVALDVANRALYIIFRGTATQAEWSFDFTVRQTSLQTQSFLSSFDNQNWQCSTETMVHTGFAQLFLQIQPQLKMFVDQTLDQVDRILVSGHSLGAAVTSLSAAYISSNLTTKPVLVYTFGKPRVGNIAYANCIAVHFPDRFWRIENNTDIVPQLPLAATPNTANSNKPWIYQSIILISYLI